MTNILDAIGVEPFKVQTIDQNEAMELEELHEPVIIKRTADILGIDKVTDKVRVPYQYYYDVKKY